jgi:hypothetical protein
VQLKYAADEKMSSESFNLCTLLIMATRRDYVHYYHEMEWGPGISCKKKSYDNAVTTGVYGGAGIIQ